MRKYLNEEKSISPIVSRSGDRLYQIIVDDFKRKYKTKEYYCSQGSRFPFVTGSFQYDVSEMDSRIGMVNVEYYIYLCYNDYEYEKIFESGIDLNSEFDNKTQRIRLVGLSMHDDLLPDFKATIYHELTHLFQYGRGMEKRESLYDKCADFTDSSDETKRKVGWLTYMTFPHEQDAMAHQFYAQLMEMQTISHIEYCIRHYSEYRIIESLMEYIKTHKNEIKPYVNELGFTVGQWYKRIHFAERRIIKKLCNAFVKYSLDRKNKTNINESLRTHKIFMKYKDVFDGIKYGLESFYKQYHL